jgi:hypothetical protein
MSVYEKILQDPGMVAHVDNTSYSGGRGKRIQCLRPAWAKVLKVCLKRHNLKKYKILQG